MLKRSVLVWFFAASFFGCVGTGEITFNINIDTTEEGDEGDEGGDDETSFEPMDPIPNPYVPKGIGGGGAMSGFTMSPYSALWYVGTDMGTLFRSYDQGQNWQAINHFETTFSSDLNVAAYVGFSSDPNVVFHAPGGVSPVRSTDAGINFESISMPLNGGEVIRYWHSDSEDLNLVFCATNQGLLRSVDKGLSWSRVSGISGESRGTFIDYESATNDIYHANDARIYRSTDQGLTFQSYYQPSGLGIRAFSGGSDENGLTLAFVDNDGTNACSWANGAPDSTPAQQLANMAACGYLWVEKSGGGFDRNTQEVGDHLKMAENNSSVIWVTGGVDWVRQYGTKVWVSEDTGASFQLKFHQYNWDTVPYEPWPSNLLDYSSVGLDVGWYDNGYESFDVNRRNASEAGGTGYFFLHVSRDHGDHWESPFTEFADVGDRTEGKKWKSTGLEVTSVFRFKFHPSNPQLGYASVADIGGYVTKDGGVSYKMIQAEYNTNYDYAFDPNNENLVFVASGATHDWPYDWHADVMVSAGGIYRSVDQGDYWLRLTPDVGSFNRQFLSVAYDPVHAVIYGGSQGGGIARSTDGGSNWEWFNNGFPGGGMIIPQIEVDDNGNVYALLTGDKPTFSNQAATGIYFLDVAGGSTTWQLLRGTVNYPPGADAGYQVWYYPTSFAIDTTTGGTGDPTTLWLTDYENNGNWLMTGVWKSTDRGATWDRVKQFTHATDIDIDSQDPNRIYVGGKYTLNGTWGEGGSQYTTNGGLTWQKNDLLPLQGNLHSVTEDPNNPDNLFYTFFGGGMLYGPKPD